MTLSMALAIATLVFNTVTLIAVLYTRRTRPRTRMRGEPRCQWPKEAETWPRFEVGARVRYTKRYADFMDDRERHGTFTVVRELENPVGPTYVLRHADGKENWTRSDCLERTPRGASE